MSCRTTHCSRSPAAGWCCGPKFRTHRANASRSTCSSPPSPRDQGEAAIGIVLSGSGSDGTLGLKAIKEGGGLTIAQEA
jgi:hypothetical protein